MCDQSGYHQDHGSPALGPSCPTEKCPPHEDSHSPDDSAKHCVHKSFGHDYRDTKPDQPLQHHDNHAWQQPQRLPKFGTV